MGVLIAAFRNPILALAVAAGSGLSSTGSANAFELAGAWATRADQSAKVFVRKGDR
jgi:hypothetical protein